MRWFMVVGLGACVGLMVGDVDRVSAAERPETAVIAPRWQRDQSWTVRAEYADIVLGRRHLAEPIADPVLEQPAEWVFRATRVAERDGRRLVRIIAQERGHARGEIGSLTFAQDFGTSGPRGPLSLVMARLLQRSGRGEPLRTEIDLGIDGAPAPALVDGSTIPFDMPVLPIGGGSSISAEAAVTAPFSDPIGVRVFPRTVSTGEGGMLYAMDVIQWEFDDPDPERFIGEGTTDALATAGHPDSGYVGVELQRPFDRRSVRQLWHPERPWPVATVSGWYRTMLVEVPAAEDLREDDPKEDPKEVVPEALEGSTIYEY